MSDFKITAVDVVKDEGNDPNAPVTFTFLVERLVPYARTELSSWVYVKIDSSEIDAADGVAIVTPLGEVQRTKLVFETTDRWKLVTVKVNGDTDVELSEILRVSIDGAELYFGDEKNPTYAPARIDPGDGTAVAVIRNDDGGPTSSVRQAALNELARARSDGLITKEETDAIRTAFGEDAAEQGLPLNEWISKELKKLAEGAIARNAQNGLQPQEKAAILAEHGSLVPVQELIDLMTKYGSVAQSHYQASLQRPQEYLIDGQKVVYGTDGNDVIEVPVSGLTLIGDDPVMLDSGAIVIGGRGFDVLKVDRAYNPSALIQRTDGAVELVGSDGSMNLLFGIERIEFTDMIWDFPQAPSALKDTGAAILQIFQFMAGATPDQDTFHNATKLIAQLNGEFGTANGWNGIGASLADSNFAPEFVAKYRSFSSDAFIDAVTTEVFGAPVNTAAVQQSFNIYVDYYAGVPVASDPTGEIRAKGYFIADMLHQASDINFGKYNEAAEVFLAGVANRSLDYGDALFG